MALPRPSEVTTFTDPQPMQMELGDVHDIVRRHPAFSESGVRALIHRSKDNGLNKHIYRLGRRVLIDLNGFEEWVRSKQDGEER